jgi:hypothetical protein
MPAAFVSLSSQGSHLRRSNFRRSLSGGLPLGWRGRVRARATGQVFRHAVVREPNRPIERGSLERRRGGATGLVVRGYVSFW